MSTHFYSQLESISNFYDLIDRKNYSHVPSDWYLIVTDVKNSTKAIESGRYKDVNFVGAMSITALLNLSKDVEIPFVFGGDGASVLIPPLLYDAASLALCSLREIVKSNFNLELRVGIISIATIYAADKKMIITKQDVSANYTQAIIRGGGMEYGDFLLKNHPQEYSLKELTKETQHADFSSLECRWQEIDSPKDMVISLLVRAAESEDSDAIYGALFAKIDAIFGNYEERHPIKAKNLHLSFNPKTLTLEASLYSAKKLKQLFDASKMVLINLIGQALMTFKVGEWGVYKNHITNTCDTQKFDDMFRSIISATQEQTQQLESYLEQEHSKGRLNYGIHKSSKSLMTCLVFERHGKHVHFVDGAKGGYALAAKMMKAQKKL